MKSACNFCGDQILSVATRFQNLFNTLTNRRKSSTQKMSQTPSVGKTSSSYSATFNARVGADWTAWEGVLGKHGVNKCNANCQLLLKLCMTYNLNITNTTFQLPHWEHIFRKTSTFFRLMLTKIQTHFKITKLFFSLTLHLLRYV